MSEAKPAAGFDYGRGAPITDFEDGQTRAGHVDGEVVLVSRRGATFYAVSGSRTH